jgi:GDP-4-dehydro-6-deoxy-D-mannose reductase
MRKQALITGPCGFVGRHMCDYLASLPERPRVIGIDIADTPPSNCDCFYKTDLSCSEHVEKIVKETVPDFIINLAGTFNKDDHIQLHRVNVLSLISLLEAARQYVPRVVMITAGSAAEYGRIQPEQLPVDEQTPCEPVTTYGLTKHLATQIALYYHRTHNICTMVLRPFQLIGRGVNTTLAPGSFAKQLRETVDKGSNIIAVGNLDSYRDFLDVRDAVAAIWALCQNPAAGEIYNLCSGKPTKIADLLQAMIGLRGTDVRIEVDPSRLRGRAEVPEVYGSYQKLRKQCGWKPKISLLESLQTMIE